MIHDLDKKVYDSIWVYEPYFALFPVKLKNDGWTWLKTVALIYDVDIKYFGGEVNDAYLVRMETVTEEALRGNREIQTLAEVRKQTE